MEEREAKRSDRILERFSGYHFYSSTSAPSKIDPVSCPVTNLAFVAIKMGRRQGARSGAYLNGYVTDEQRSRRPIFITAHRAVVSWLFFHVARSLRIHSDMLVARALKNSQLTDGEKPCYLWDRTLKSKPA
jgi:hypothetical protein